MRASPRILIAAATMAMVASAGPAMARGYNGSAINMIDPASFNYSGHYPVTVTRSQRSNGTDCLTLNGRGHFGSASLVGGSQQFPAGTFLVMDGLLVATIPQPLSGQNGALMFIVPASLGHIGRGVFEDVEGGADFDAGDLTFGMKNGC